MSNILVVDDDPSIRELIEFALSTMGHHIIQASDGGEALAQVDREPVDLVITDFLMPGMNGAEFLDRLHRSHPRVQSIMITAYGTPEAVISALRNHVTDFILKPFSLEDIRRAVNSALAGRSVDAVEVISARPEWVELRIPSDLSSVPTVQRLLGQLTADLPVETRDAISFAFSEMLNNAIEYGGKFDPGNRVSVSYVRLKRAILYRIKDPGEGFDPKSLEHAAIGNPEGDVLHHAVVRETKGMRAGGFGILLTHKLVDELIYNERCNEVIFVKYL